jgi:hypothetical protein
VGKVVKFPDKGAPQAPAHSPEAPDYTKGLWPELLARFGTPEAVFAAVERETRNGEILDRARGRRPGFVDRDRSRR